MTAFQADIQQLDDLCHVQLSGPLDEDNQLAALVERVRGAVAVFDLAAVEDINNCGVRDWVNGLEELQGRGVHVVLSGCSPAIVAKLNSVGNFAAGATVKSFFIPYYCGQCEEERALLWEVAQLSEPGAPTCRCDSCDGVMSFDGGLEEAYFAFVSDARARPLSPELEALIARMAPSTSQERQVAPVADFATGISSVSMPSVNTLRRLRDRTGLRTLRRVETKPAPTRLPALLSALGGGVLLVALILLALKGC